MGKNRGAAAPAPSAPHVMKDSDIPIGGRDQFAVVPRPEPDTIEWSGVGTEVQGDNNGEVVAASVPRAPDEARDAKIARLLRGEPADTEKPAETATSEAKAESTTEEKPAAEAKDDDSVKTPVVKAEPPKVGRRDLLANLEAERKKRETEAELGNSRTKIAELEAALKSKDDEVKAAATADLYKIARARGLTREQALEAIIAAEEGDDTPVTPTAAKAETKAEDPTIAELRAKVAKMEARDQEAQAIQAYATVTKVIEPLEAPTLKAVKTISMPMSDANGASIVQQMTKEAAVLTLAESMWNGDGKPTAANKNDYLVRAAEVLNEAIESGEIAASVDRRSAVPPVKSTAKSVATAEVEEDAVPAVGTRMGGGGAPKSAGDGLPKDEHERKAEIKRRFGLRG